MSLGLNRLREMSLRDLILALVLVGNLGLIVELVLLKHTDSLTQWIPLVSLAVGVIATVMAQVAPTPGSLKSFQLIMGLFVIIGVLGLYFHYAGNVEFALERDPEMHGATLVWKALRGATPSLAPGALVQLGLLGLIYCYRHPVLGDTGSHIKETQP